MSFTLYELKDRYLELLDYIESIEETDAQAFEDTLQLLEDDLETKIDNIVTVIKSIEGEAKALEEEKKRIEARISARKNKVARLKNYLEDNLIAGEKEKVKTTLFSVWIQNNPPSVEIPDEEIISDEYKIEQAPKVDKKTIIDLLKKGESVEGASLKTTRSIRLR